MKNSLLKKIIICILFVVIALSLLVLPNPGNDGFTNIFELIFRQTSSASPKEEVAWQAMGSTVAHGDDEEEYFSLHAQTLNFHVSSDIMKSLEAFWLLFIFLYLVIFKNEKFISCVLSGPFGGNSPPSFVF